MTHFFPRRRASDLVLDMTASYYLGTVLIVFQEQLLPRGLWDVDGERVRPSAIKDTALLSIEGELDDISGAGQTRAAHELCTGIAEADRQQDRKSTRLNSSH